LWIDSSQEPVDGSAIEISIALSATSNLSMTLRMPLAAIPRSVRTGVWQHAWDIFAELQSPAIPWQQSISDLVIVWPGIKQASSGTSPQASTTAKTNARNGHDMCRVYISVSRMKASAGEPCLRPRVVQHSDYAASRRLTLNIL